MDTSFRRLLLSELNCAVYTTGDGALSSEALARACTLNENLHALGYTLKPADIAAMAQSPSISTFYESIEELLGDVKACPMYPGFPQQVMDMSEAQFRFHQLVHYFSTYGLEMLTGERVLRGWLPHEKGDIQFASADGTPRERTRPDTQIRAEKGERLLSAKVLELLTAQDAYRVPVQRIMARRERMTLPESELVRMAVPHMSAEELAQTTVLFKENQKILLLTIFETMDSQTAALALRALCQHTGDVLALLVSVLAKHHYHLTTSQKRRMVRLIETYPVEDWRANVILTNQKAERNVELIARLDYSRFTRSAEHMRVVDQLRDGELRSWAGQAEALLTAGEPGALDFIAKRPGLMLRMVSRLLKMGYSEGEIKQRLTANASSLSVQTLVNVMNLFSTTELSERVYAPEICAIMEAALTSRLRFSDTPFKGKRVFVDEGKMDLSHSQLRIGDRSQEGGYIRSGMAYRIPSEVRYLRFFVYWDDRERVDVDLHASLIDKNHQQYGIGWNTGYKNDGAVFSGDITHSDATEYVDITLDSSVRRVSANIHLFSGKASFSEIETCYVGMMALNSPRQAVERYKPVDCFFTHTLRQRCETINYGWVDTVNRCLIFDGTPTNDVGNWYGERTHATGALSIARYLRLLFQSQNAIMVTARKYADIVLVMEKATQDNEISLLDENFFMES